MGTSEGILEIAENCHLIPARVYKRYTGDTFTRDADFLHFAQFVSEKMMNYAENGIKVIETNGNSWYAFDLEYYDKVWEYLQKLEYYRDGAKFVDTALVATDTLKERYISAVKETLTTINGKYIVDKSIENMTKYDLGFRIPQVFIGNQELFWAFIKKFMHYNSAGLVKILENNWHEIHQAFSDEEFEKLIDFMVNNNADFSIFVERWIEGEVTERLFTAVQKSTEKKEAKDQADKKLLRKTLKEKVATLKTEFSEETLSEIVALDFVEEDFTEKDWKLFQETHLRYLEALEFKHGRKAMKDLSLGLLADDRFTPMLLDIIRDKVQALVLKVAKDRELTLDDEFSRRIEGNIMEVTDRKIQELNELREQAKQILQQKEEAEARRKAEEKRIEQKRKNQERINFVNDLVGRVKEI